MLNKIKGIIQDSIREALTFKITYEQHRDLNTGQPLASPKIVEREMFLPVWIIEHLPYTEGALRGLQETVDKQANEIRRLNEKIGYLNKTLSLVYDNKTQVKELGNSQFLLEGERDDANIS
jgi:hypothetical protein